MPDPPDAPLPRPLAESTREAGSAENLEMTVDPALSPVLEFIHGSETPLREMTPSKARATASRFPRPRQSRTPMDDVRDLVIPGPGGDIPARLLRPRKDQGLPLVVAFHGGGWVLGDLDGFEPEARLLAAGGDCAVLAVDYRLAPEHPFPAAIEDAFAATEWASANAASLGCDAGRLGVAGMSAGGNLAAAVTIMARDAGIPGLRFQLLVYPVLDADLDRPTMHAFGEGLALERADMEWFWNQYCPDHAQRSDPRASPLQATTLAGLPPAYLALAALDPLLDEALDYATALQSAGVRTEIRVAPRMIHGFFSCGPLCEAAAAEIERAVTALQHALHADTRP
ncbi:MAG: alpha/beta hydrolase [Phycisphaerales bacterium]|nr:alpha/beta hydrolase [Phycisphaerales bacterium]